MGEPWGRTPERVGFRGSRVSVLRFSGLGVKGLGFRGQGSGVLLPKKQCGAQKCMGFYSCSTIASGRQKRVLGFYCRL